MDVIGVYFADMSSKFASYTGRSCHRGLDATGSVGQLILDSIQPS
jgi:hypothetical protein